MKPINAYMKFTTLSRLLLIGTVMSLPAALASAQSSSALQDELLFSASGLDILVGDDGGSGDGGSGDGGSGDGGSGASGSGDGACGASGDGSADGSADGGACGASGDGGTGAGDGSGSGSDGGGGGSDYVPYDHPNAICTPDTMISKWVDQLDQPGYNVQEFWTSEYYLSVPNDIVTDPRSGRETMSWAAYRGGVLVAEGVIEGDAWIGAHGGYGRGEATIDVPEGIDSIIFFSDEIGSDGNLEYVRGVAMVPEFFKGRHRITR